MSSTYTSEGHGSPMADHIPVSEVWATLWQTVSQQASVFWAVMVANPVLTAGFAACTLLVVQVLVYAPVRRAIEGARGAPRVLGVMLGLSVACMSTLAMMGLAIATVTVSDDGVSGPGTLGVGVAMTGAVALISAVARIAIALPAPERFPASDGATDLKARQERFVKTSVSKKIIQ